MTYVGLDAARGGVGGYKVDLRRGERVGRASSEWSLFWSAVINGVVAVPVMVMMMLLASRPKIMGRLTLTRGLLVVGWTATGVMALAAIGMLATIGH